MAINSILPGLQRAIVRGFEQGAVTRAPAARTAAHRGLDTKPAWHHRVGCAVLLCPDGGRCDQDVVNCGGCASGAVIWSG